MTDVPSQTMYCTSNAMKYASQVGILRAPIEHDMQNHKAGIARITNLEKFLRA
jgi:hypothetical protein